MEKKDLMTEEKYLSKHGWPVILKNIGEGEHEGKVKVYLVTTKAEIVLPIADLQPYVEENVHKDARSAMAHQEKQERNQVEDSKEDGAEPKKKGKARKNKVKKAERKEKKRRFFLPVWLFLDPTRGYGRLSERMGIMRSLAKWSLNELAGRALHKLFKEKTASEIHELIGTCKIAKMHSPNDKNYLDSRKAKK